MQNKQTQIDTQIGPFQLAILLLSLVLLAALAADTLLTLPPEVSQVIQTMDTIVCGVLLVDFLVRLHRAESKRDFMKWGWIDLLACIPNVDALRWGRLIRVLRVIRLLRGIRSLHRIFLLIFQNKRQGGAASLGLMAFLLITFSSVAILVCERQPQSNIQTAEDALWWSVTTATTVGYGDKYPVTTEGRLVGVLLMICGVGMFAGLSGLIASLLLGSNESAPPSPDELTARLQEMEKKIDALRLVIQHHQPPK
ncbi:ion transporter [Fontisphaera persica]|uniref:ion transporter n=1 Tax=Fontisphaera persica TaxID=2974023 RepID=UPI0024C0B170|nr:ion transporter [Fontisphaera persica]WCJ59610.1 ion transporter [Fontisphaera persica]